MVRHRSTRWLAPAVLVVALASVPIPAAGSPVVYPRLGLYEMVYPDGWPLLDSAGVVNAEVVAQMARFDEIVIDPSPITDHRPDLMAAIRARNPGISVLAYVPAQDVWWLGESADSLVDLPTRSSHLMRDLDGWLYARNGTVYNFGVNIARRDSTGRFIVAEALVDLWYDAIVRTGLWDGLFLDIYCDCIAWTQSPAESVDVVRAGYPDWDSFNAAWLAATDTIASRLRRRCGPDYILVGNCATGTKYTTFNGWMREGFPYQAGGTWYLNMLRVPGGYFADEAAFRPPTHDYIFSAMVGADSHSATNARRARFGLASASLGNGFAVFGPSDRDPRIAPIHAFWYDEYAVDPASGAASPDPAHRGWLGAATGDCYQMIWAGGGADAVVNPGFESSVTDGWRFWNHASASATLLRDSTTSALGRSSARVHVESGGSEVWHVTYASTGELALTAGRNYAATFWARASRPRTIVVAAAVTGMGYASGVVSLGTAWKQYQVVLQPTVSCTAQLRFWLGADDGDVWLDDAHLQAGVSGIYRRDFERGAVLVNPSESALTVPLGTTFRKILGTVDPVTNDGTSVTEVTVPASDAIFLIGTDTIPPDAPRDLRIGR